MTINLSRKWKKMLNRFKNKKYSRLKSNRTLTPAEKRLRMVKTIRLLSLVALVGLVVSFILFFVAFAWVSRNLPKPGEVVRVEGFNTKIFDRNGELVHDLYQAEKRDPVPIEEIPDALKHATIAVEDKDFYNHKGFDFMTILRIPYNYIFKQGRVIGGSTLTQQLVKNVLLTNERTVTRKFKEFVLSLQIERKFTKDEILSMYLNEVPYGGVSIGVGAASESYFDKKVHELSLAESAILAGLPQRPSAYSPFLGKTDEDGTLLWRLRAEGVLRRMVEDGYITELERETALSEMDTMEFTRESGSIEAPHFVFYVEEQLNEMFGEDVLKRGGLQVTTTLDLELQKEAQSIVYEEVDSLTDYDISNGAAMVLNPNTGEILSMVGSKDYFDSEIGGQFNVAVDGLRQPGSSIKPLTYLAMFQKGYSPASMIVDVETTFAPNDTIDKPYQPKNYDGQFRGPVTLRNSLGSSLNIPAVKSLAIVGVDNWLSLAYKMGFGTLEPTKENMQRFGLSATLGGAEVHLIDTVSAYSAFANGGRKVEPVSILKVENVDGQVLYEYKPVNGPEVISEAEAFLINDVLSDNNARLLAFGANSLLNMGSGVAVKTGTTNDQRDNWTIGWNQNVIVGTWVGNNDNSPMSYVASGVTGASPIWRSIMQKAISLGYETEEWEVPNGVERVEVDKISGYPAHDGFETRQDYYLKGTLPSLPDPIHTKLKVCRDDSRKLATDAKVATGDYEEKEFIALREEDPVSQDGKNRWQEAINTWVESREGELYKPPTEYCGESGDVAVKLSKPENEKKYDNEDIEVHIDADSGEGIEKIELWVNGSLKETINNRSYRGKIHLSKGRYEIYAKALSRSGKWSESNKVKIGTGGEDWKQPEPSPSPSPSPTPAVVPSPSPSPVVEVTPSPNLDLDI
jgi:penicillin-binding protein 1C